MSFLRTLLAPENLLRLPVAFVWFPAILYGIVNDKEWGGAGWWLLLVWFIVAGILYPLLLGPGAMLVDSLAKRKHHEG